MIAISVLLMKCCEFEKLVTILVNVRSQIDHINSILQVFCINSEDLFDFSKQLIFQAFSFPLLEFYKMLIFNGFLIDLKNKKKFFTI